MYCNFFHWSMGVAYFSFPEKQQEAFWGNRGLSNILTSLMLRYCPVEARDRQGLYFSLFWFGISQIKFKWKKHNDSLEGSSAEEEIKLPAGKPWSIFCGSRNFISVVLGKHRRLRQNLVLPVWRFIPCRWQICWQDKLQSPRIRM